MYKKIFVPVDNSEHSMSSIDIAVELAKKFDSALVGSHAYAARMHDYRFKQMEYTLPEEYLVEQEMEKQRRVHDTLITMGLELISDSYLVVMEQRAREEKLAFLPKMYDGKNYKVIADDINESDYDLVVLGALGLGEGLLPDICEVVDDGAVEDVHLVIAPCDPGKCFRVTGQQAVLQPVQHLDRDVTGERVARDLVV